jgi:hypothetical protein
MKALDNGEDVNEVEGAGNTPLHCAAYEGWLEGCELLLNLGAKLNASNNAGDRPWHWAKNMGHTEVMEFLEKVSFFCFYKIYWRKSYTRFVLYHQYFLQLNAPLPAHRLQIRLSLFC